MISRISVVAGAASLAFGFWLAPAPQAAADPVRFDSVYVFGDSLSDPGNFFALTEALTGTGEPGFPYVDGRFTNGPVWAEYLASDFASAGLGFRNYAHGFARVVSPPAPVAGEPASFLPINLDDQLDLFLDDAAGGVSPRAGAIAWLGSNDSFAIILRALTAIEGGDDPLDAVLQAIDEAQATAAQLLDRLTVLAPAGVRDLLLLNLPDFAQIPLFAGTEAAELASIVTGSFNAALAAGTVEGVNLRRFDLASLFDGLAMAPEDFGVSSLEACFNQIDFSGLCSDPNARAFYDLVHPSAPIHARLAQELRAVVAPIPLPAAAWLLLAGLAGLGALRLRRQG